jgi:hypothetical protein
MTIAIASTSSVEHSRRLQPNRRSIQVTTGKRTAVLKMETKTTSRTFAIDASAHATAATAATRRIVWIEIVTSTFERPVCLAAAADSIAVTRPSYRRRRMTYGSVPPPSRCDCTQIPLCDGEHEERDAAPEKSARNDVCEPVDL